MQFGDASAVSGRESVPWPRKFVVPVLCQLGWLSKARSVRKAERLPSVRRRALVSARHAGPSRGGFTADSLVASFSNGVRRDEAAVRAAITLPWSNAQTEGQITRLKLVKRQMYGRGKIDLLQARLIGAE
jgi:hypothetical protein